jgi:GT2 family glycosyltransferase
VDIYIGILTRGQVRAELAAAVAAMNTDSRYDIYTEYSWARPTPSNRNKIAAAALDKEAQFVLMLDSDVQPLRNLLDLVERDLDIVSFPCPIWRPGKPEPPVVMNITPLEGRRNVDLGGADPFEIMRGGGSAMLIARRVLEAMHPAFHYNYDDEGMAETGEDIAFFDDARERGFKVWTAPQYLCEHYKHVGLLKVVNEFARFVELA